MCQFGKFLRAAILGLRQRSWDDMFAESRGISVLIVIPRSLGGAHFNDRQRLEINLLKNPYSNFLAFDTLLNQNPLIVRKRLLKSRFEFSDIFWKSDAQRRTLSGRFDHDIQAEIFDHPSRCYSGTVTPIHNHVPCDWKARISEQVLGDDLIHSASARVYPTSHVRQAEGFQESLKCSIFPGRAVQHWEDYVHAIPFQSLGDVCIELQQNYL